MDCWKQILNSRRSYSEIIKHPLPSQSGVYSFFLKSQEFPFFQLTDIYPEFSFDTPIYVGISQKLARRDIFDHFEGESKKSTLRRTIGAIFCDDWKLQPIPRDNQGKASSYSHYSFTSEGKISEWMHQNFTIGHCEIPYHACNSLERELIQQKQPVLNIQYSLNKKTIAILKQVRKACAKKAREYDYPRH